MLSSCLSQRQELALSLSVKRQRTSLETALLMYPWEWVVEGSNLATQ